MRSKKLAANDYRESPGHLTRRPSELLRIPKTRRLRSGLCMQTSHLELAHYLLAERVQKKERDQPRMRRLMMAFASLTTSDAHAQSFCTLSREPGLAYDWKRTLPPIALIRAPLAIHSRSTSFARGPKANRKCSELFAGFDADRDPALPTTTIEGRCCILSPPLVPRAPVGADLVHVRLSRAHPRYRRYPGWV
jgi:hypothetical protein